MIDGIIFHTLLLDKEQISRFIKGEVAIDLNGDYLVDLTNYKKTWKKSPASEKEKFEDFSEFLFMFFDLLDVKGLDKIDDYRSPHQSYVNKYDLGDNKYLILIALEERI